MSNKITRDNMDEIFKALGKEYRKMGGKAMPTEIDIVGGAAIIRRYGFRTASSDIDAIIHAASAIKDAANKVGDIPILCTPHRIRISCLFIRIHTGHLQMYSLLGLSNRNISPQCRNTCNAF